MGVEDWEADHEDDRQGESEEHDGHEEDEDDEKEEQERRYSDGLHWWTEYLQPSIRRAARGDQVWCDQWWRHPEAVERIDALWVAWESASAEHTLSGWWIYHFDPHWATLTDGNRGPFSACKDGHHELDQLAWRQPPDEWLIAYEQLRSVDDAPAAGMAAEAERVAREELAPDPGSES